MAGRERSSVFVAVPVYKGSRFVAGRCARSSARPTATCGSSSRSMATTRASAAACEPFLADERVRMVVQPRQLGWIGQPELAHRCLRRRLLLLLAAGRPVCAGVPREAGRCPLRHPDAACAYSDCAGSGESPDDVLPEMVGFDQQRILAQIEALHWIPLRAVVPDRCAAAGRPVRGIDDTMPSRTSCGSWALAIAGDLVRVPEVLYFRSAPQGQRLAQPKGRRGFQRSQREAWIMLGLEIFAAVAPRFEERESPKLAAVIADRLVTSRAPTLVALRCQRGSRRRRRPWWRWTSSAALEARTGVKPPHGGPSDAEGARRALVATMRHGGPVTLDCSASGWAAELLVEGWRSLRTGVPGATATARDCGCPCLAEADDGSSGSSVRGMSVHQRSAPTRASSSRRRTRSSSTASWSTVWRSRRSRCRKARTRATGLSSGSRCRTPRPRPRSASATICGG